LSSESQDAMHTLGSNRVYIHGIHKIKSFVSKVVTCTSYFIQVGSLFQLIHNSVKNVHVN